MKFYNSFNEMFCSNGSNKECVNIFNYYEPWDSFVERVGRGIDYAVDEWFDNLSDERKEAILACIPSGGGAHDAWDYIQENEWDALYDTNAYKEMCDYILDGNPGQMFYEVCEEPFVRERLKDYYGLNYWDTKALRDFYPKGYVKGVVSDAIYWVGEEMDGYDWWTYLEPKIEELQEEYWESKQQKFDFD